MGSMAFDHHESTNTIIRNSESPQDVHNPWSMQDQSLQQKPESQPSRCRTYCSQEQAPFISRRSLPAQRRAIRLRDFRGPTKTCLESVIGLWIKIRAGILVLVLYPSY